MTISVIKGLFLRTSQCTEAPVAFLKRWQWPLIMAALAWPGDDAPPRPLEHDA